MRSHIRPCLCQEPRLNVLVRIYASGFGYSICILRPGSAPVLHILWRLLRRSVDEFLPPRSRRGRQLRRHLCRRFAQFRHERYLWQNKVRQANSRARHWWERRHTRWQEIAMELSLRGRQPPCGVSLSAQAGNGCAVLRSDCSRWGELRAGIHVLVDGHSSRDLTPQLNPQLAPRVQLVYELVHFNFSGVQLSFASEDLVLCVNDRVGGKFGLLLPSGGGTEFVGVKSANLGQCTGLKDQNTYADVGISTSIKTYGLMRK